MTNDYRNRRVAILILKQHKRRVLAISAQLNLSHILIKFIGARWQQIYETICVGVFLGAFPYLSLIHWNGGYWHSKKLGGFLCGLLLNEGLNLCFFGHVLYISWAALLVWAQAGWRQCVSRQEAVITLLPKR
jgi:hypothetical protein